MSGVAVAACNLQTILSCTRLFSLYADLATGLGDLSVEPGCLQGHSASLQSALQLSCGREQVDPAWRPHPCALNPVQCAEPVLCTEPHHMAVSPSRHGHMIPDHCCLSRSFHLTSTFHISGKGNAEPRSSCLSPVVCCMLDDNSRSKQMAYECVSMLLILRSNSVHLQAVACGWAYGAGLDSSNIV